MQKKKYIKFHEPLPFPYLKVCICDDDEFIAKIKALEEELLDFRKIEEELNKRIIDLRKYISDLLHGLHFISRGEEPPIVCSRLDFMA
jgi:hypothetical protein